MAVVHCPEAPPYPTEVLRSAGQLAEHLEWIEDAVVADFVLQVGAAGLVEKLETDVVTYSEAVEACGWYHSDTYTGEALE